MANHEIQLGDFIEINMAIENDRKLATWTEKRIYPILNSLQPGDTITVLPELPQEEHYKENEDA